MKLYVDMDLLAVIEAPGVQAVVSQMKFKRGTAPLFQVQFGRNNPASGEWAPELLPSGSALRFGLKEVGKYDGDFLVFTDDWTDAVNPLTDYYEATPSFNTTEVNTLLASPDGDENNDVESVTLMGEFSWAVGADLPTKTETFEAIVHNAVDNGAESTPSIGPYGNRLQVAYKAADTSRTSSAIPASDPDLTADVAANGVYAFDLWLHVTAASSTPDIQCGMLFPASPTSADWELISFDYDAGTVAPVAIVGGSSVTELVTMTADNTLHIHGTLRNGPNAGTIDFCWSQATSSVDATTVKRGSRMITTKLE